jgi:hypothetical protein
VASDPILTTKERPGSYDAIATAKPDEPLFPIQGGDPFGPQTVLYWAQLARAGAMKEIDPNKASRLFRKATEAELVAWSMLEYQRGHAQPEARRARYNDDQPAKEETAARTEREALIKGADKLQSLLSEALGVAETLAQFRTHPEQEVKIRDAAAMLREAALEIEPRRGRERS